MNMKNISLIATSVVIIGAGNVSLQGADLFANGSTYPQVQFDSTYNGAGWDWLLEASGDTAHGLQFWNNVTSSNVKTFQIINSINNENSFMVDSSGDINLADGSVFIDKSANWMGIGTTTPTAALDVVGSIHASYKLLLGGKWMVENNSKWFNMGVDRTFTILEDAPFGSLAVNNDGNVSVGIGLLDPSDYGTDAKLHVFGDIRSDVVVNNTKTREFTLALSRENSGGHSDVGFSLENKTDGHNGSFKWTFQTAYQSEGFTATKIGTGGYEFAVKNPTDDVNNVELAAAGKVFFTGGHLQDPSSRAYKDDIKTLDTKTALEAFEKLEAVTFVYKEHKEDQVVGFIAEDVPELLAMKGRKGINPTEIVAVLTKVVQTQDAEIKEMKAEIAELKVMKQKVAQLESILTNLALDTSNTKKEKVSFNLK